MWTMRHGRLIGRDATVAQVDVDDAALGANRPVDLGVVGDCGQTPTTVLAHLADRAPRREGYRTAAVADAHRGRGALERRADRGPLHRRPDRPADAEPASWTTCCRPSGSSPIDSGNFMGYPSAYLGVPDEFGFCFTQAFQSIGLGLSTAIGAALARPDRLPVARHRRRRLPDVGRRAGDRGAAGHAAGVIVYNDAAYGAEVHHFGRRRPTWRRSPSPTPTSPRSPAASAPTD